jgi:hypothetical protein
MKPVIIQQLMRRNKKPRNTEPLTDDIEQYSSRSANFVLLFVAIMVVAGLLLS